METPYMWIRYRYQAPAGRLPIVLAGAIVTLLLAMSFVSALMPR